MNYRKVTPVFIKVAKQFQQDMEEAVDYLEKQDLIVRMKRMNPQVDARDFVPMVALMGVVGDTKEERAADIHKKMDALTAAFEDPDLEERDDYLDLIYYLVDDFGVHFDPVTMNMGNPVEVARLFQSTLIEQTIGTKKNENPEYYQKRYPTPEQRNLADAHDRYRMAVGSTVMKNLADQGIEINIKLSLPRVFPKEATEIQYCREIYERNLLEKMIETGGVVDPTETVDFPILDNMVPFAGKNVADVVNYSAADANHMNNYYNFLIENTLLQRGSKNTQAIKEADISEVKEAVYVDGKPLASFIKEHLPNIVKRSTTEGAIISTCLLSGKHKVDVVNAYRDESGEMQYEAKTLRASVTKEQEAQYLQQFNWVRRLFNWWPFQIETLQQKMDRIAQDPGTAQRHADVVEDHKEKIATAMAKKAERELEIQREQQMNEQRREAYEKEKNRLAESATRWDENSVLGILGKEIAGDYDVKGKKVNGICEAIRSTIATSDPPTRYDKISQMFAKLALYSQLCNEREANGGKPGETEKRLYNEDPKTTKENIENAATLLATNPAFKNLYLEKAGTQEGRLCCPSGTNFESLIAFGGYRRFSLECMQRQSQTADRAMTNENNPELQMQQNAPKASM